MRQRAIVKVESIRYTIREVFVWRQVILMKCIAGSGITQEGIDLHEAEGLYAAVQTKDSDIWYALYQHADFRQCVADIYT